MMKKDENNRAIKIIEDFIETKNRYIQSILLIITTIAGVAYGFVDSEMQTIIRYTLVTNLFIELYLLQAKDSIMQDKVNWIRVEVQKRTGGLRFEKEISIKNYFENAKKDFFVSGIAINRFLDKYRNELISLLEGDRDFKVYILISSLKAIPENNAQYHGCNDINDEKTKYYQKGLIAKIKQTLLVIKTEDELYKAFNEGRLIIHVTDIVFTISCVTYDIFAQDTHMNKKMKISFYQQGEHTVGNIPSVEIESDRNQRDMYPYFKNVICHQWESGKKILNSDELDELINNIEKQEILTPDN